MRQGLPSTKEKYSHMSIIKMNMTTNGEPSPYAVLCNHGKDHIFARCYLDRQEYDRQIRNADALWICPVCGREACWDDENYETWMQKPEHQ